MLDDAQRREFYKSHRERDATGYKKKHRLQYDREFAALTGAEWYWISPPVALAFPLHVMDLRTRRAG